MSTTNDGSGDLNTVYSTEMVTSNRVTIYNTTTPSESATTEFNTSKSTQVSPGSSNLTSVSTKVALAGWAQLEVKGGGSTFTVDIFDAIGDTPGLTFWPIGESRYLCGNRTRNSSTSVEFSNGESGWIYSPDGTPARVIREGERSFRLLSNGKYTATRDMDAVLVPCVRDDGEYRQYTTTDDKFNIPAWGASIDYDESIEQNYLGTVDLIFYGYKSNRTTEWTTEVDAVNRSTEFLTDRLTEVSPSTTHITQHNTTFLEPVITTSYVTGDTGDGGGAVETPPWLTEVETNVATLIQTEFNTSQQTSSDGSEIRTTVYDTSWSGGVTNTSRTTSHVTNVGSSWTTSATTEHVEYELSSRTTAKTTTYNTSAGYTRLTQMRRDTVGTNTVAVYTDAATQKTVSTAIQHYTNKVVSTSRYTKELVGYNTTYENGEAKLTPIYTNLGTTTYDQAVVQLTNSGSYRNTTKSGTTRIPSGRFTVLNNDTYQTVWFETEMNWSTSRSTNVTTTVTGAGSVGEVTTSWLTGADQSVATVYSTTVQTIVGEGGSRSTSHQTAGEGAVISTTEWAVSKETEYLTGHSTERQTFADDGSSKPLITAYRNTSRATLYPPTYTSTAYVDPRSTEHITSRPTNVTTTIGYGPEDQYYYLNPTANALDLDVYLRAGEGIPAVGQVYMLVPEANTGGALAMLPNGNSAVGARIALTANGWELVESGRYAAADYSGNYVLFKEDGVGSYIAADADIVPISLTPDEVTTEQLAWDLRISHTTSFQTTVDETVSLITDYISFVDTEVSSETSLVTNWTTEYMVEGSGSGSTSYVTNWITDGVYITSKPTALGPEDINTRSTSVSTAYSTTYQSAMQTFHQTVGVTQGQTELSTIKMEPTRFLTQRETTVTTSSYTFAYTKNSTSKVTTINGIMITRTNPGDPRSPYTNTAFSSSWRTRWETRKTTTRRTQSVVGQRITDHYTQWNTGKIRPTFSATQKETVYDTHYETSAEKHESGNRLTHWDTAPAVGSIIETNWETAGPKLTSATTSYTGTSEDDTMGLGGSGVGYESKTTEYLTGDGSERYLTNYITQARVWDTLEKNTWATTDYFTSTILEASTDILSTQAVTVATATARVTDGEFGTRVLTEFDTFHLSNQVSTDVRLTNKPREVEVSRTTNWNTQVVTQRMSSFLTSHETVVGDDLHYTSHMTEVQVEEYDPSYLNAQVAQHQIPPLDIVGPFTFEAPFDQYNYQILKSLSVEDMGLLARRGVDVYAEVYQPYGISREDYLRDFDAGAKLITLTSVDENIEVVIPSPYVITVPDNNYVAYSHLMVVTDLGLLPDDLDLDVTRQEIEELLRKTVGRAPTVEVLRMPIEGGVTSDQHKLMEANRKRNIESVPSLQSEINRLKQRLSEEIERNALLEEALISLSDDA